MPATKTVMLNDRKKRRGRGWPMTWGRRHGLIIHYRDEPDDGKEQGKDPAPAGGEGHRRGDQCQEAWSVPPGGVLFGS